jgi:HEAT repeat protein
MLWLLQRQLKSGNVATRRKAVEALVRTPDPRALDALRETLEDEDVEVRQLAVAALAELQDERRINPLLSALRDAEPEVQKAAITALRHIKDDRIIDALAPLVRHADMGVCSAAVRALETLNWRPPTREDAIWFSVIRGQFTHAASYGVAAIPALENMIGFGPYNMRVAAVQAIGSIGDARVLRPLIRALQSEDGAVCMAAIESLGRIGGQQATDAVTGMLRHENNHVRTAAAEALGLMECPSAVGALRELLSDPDWDVRRAVTESLGRLKDTNAAEAMTRGLEDPDSDVREATALALGNLDDRCAIGPLVRCLSDPATSVRRIAAAALARIDEHWSESAEAQSAFEQMQAGQHAAGAGGPLVLAGSKAGSKTGPSSTPMQEHPDALSLIPEKNRKLAVSMFIAILCDTDRDLRQAAAEALGRLADRRAESALMRAMGDADAGVRYSVERALHALGVVTEGIKE